MKLNSLKTSRRTVLVGAGAATAAAGAAGLAAVMKSGDGAATPVGSINPQDVKALGDGFYLADGWVLSDDDLKEWRITAENPGAR